MPKGHYEHKLRTADLTGQKFGDWTVIGRGEPRGREGRRWVCRCVCGVVREVTRATLRNGKSTGCGCAAAKRFSEGLITHGKSRTPEYRTWIAMRSRCQNPRNTKYDLYGGRGIKVDPSWDVDFETFLRDMGPKPSPRHSIERIDGDGNYDPGNCRWAEIDEQNVNTARNHYLTFEGETMTISQWARHLGMSYGALHARIADGWSVEHALTIPPGRGAARHAHRIAVQGDTGSL